MTKNLSDPAASRQSAGMKLEDLPRVVPGATVRVKLTQRLHFVTIKHEGRIGHGTHKKLTFATRRAVLSLAAPP